jgi:acetylornithine/N-succinyldiaminopimelate aminotransferase
MRHVMKTYGRKEISFVRGEGIWLFDSNGKKYLDALCGIAVTGLGHCHPSVVEAVSEQSKTLMHASNLYNIPEQEKLATELAKISQMDAMFFCNSGAEANEVAIKLARLYGHKRGTEKPNIIVMEQSFHGRTMATLSATGNRKVQAGFEPLLGGFSRVPFDDIDAVRAVGENNPDTVAILVEPVQGEGGIRIPRPTYLEELRDVCVKNNWLLMVDEVQSGMGRTGSWFAHQQTGIIPDVMTLAKGLGNGIPIGACLAKGEAAEILTPGTHGSTFGGNPVASRAALATIQAIAKESLLENAKRQGDLITKRLKEAFDGNSSVVNIRNKGLMIGVELNESCGQIVDLALESGLLLNVTADKVVRLLPPLILTDNDSETMAGMVATVIKKFLSK